MLQLTKRTEYGLIALTHLAGREGEVTSVREIAEHYSVPRRLLAEVLKELCRTGHVISQRGASGGYSLSRPANAVTLGEVVAALEGRPSITGCETMGAFKLDGCDVEPRCPIRSPLQRIRSGIWNMMQRTTLSDLANPGFNFDPAKFDSKSPELSSLDSGDQNSDYTSRIPFSA
ncbi:MAG: Rrf2 family protein [Planctomycetota bacterium]